MLKYRNKRLIPISTRLQRVELEKSEIETLHYVAGFKVFSLKKSLKKYNPLALEISILLGSWGSKSDNHFDCSSTEYTNAWVDLGNRGGFHHVSDELYLFIKAVEMEARTILNQDYSLIIAMKTWKWYYIICSQRVKILKYAGIKLLGI